ncbi:MAG: prolipoprotein diacylglyceryl transferase [Erysipelotrichaceae bacterium]|nr:prolipoprotein diacylglyceryl transferase [Erysipelotrichaceae bacterium]
MEFFPSREVILTIGNLEIRWYAVLIISGALLAYYLAGRDVKKAGYHSDVIDDLFVGMMLCGMIGARLWYVAFSNLDYYLEDPMRIFQVWNGGLAIHGAVVGGVLFGYFYCRKNHYSLMHLLDLILPHVLLAQAIGRWGNFANQECYGPVVEESFFRFIPGFVKNGMFIDGAYRMPMFFFESVLCVIGWCLIRLLRKTYRPQRGNGAYAYVAWYGIVRFGIEHFRTDSLMIGGLKMAQVTSVFGVILGVAGLMGAFNKYFMKEKPLLIFDLDGTVLDTEKIIVASFQEVLGKYKPDLVLTEEDKVSFLGPTLQESFKKYAPDCDTETLVEEYRIANRKLHDAGLVKPIEHVPELLEYLKSEGYRMCIASSKKSETCLEGLKICGLDGYFESITGVEEVTVPKPDKETLMRAYKKMGCSQANTVYIGDSGSDVRCAQNAGVFSIGYVSNELKRQEIIDSKPNRLINDMLEIKDVLKEEHLWTYNMM